MAEQKTYNGWTNYETWNVALWIGNEQGSYEYWEKEQAEECYRNAVGASSDGRDEWTDQAANELAERMESEFKENSPLADKPTVYSDLLSAALSEVNWYEIAKNYIEDLDRDEIEKEIVTAEAEDE